MIMETHILKTMFLLNIKNICHRVIDAVDSIKLHTFARQLKESVWVPAFATLDRKLATLR